VGGTTAGSCVGVRQRVSQDAGNGSEAVPISAPIRCLEWLPAREDDRFVDVMLMPEGVEMLNACGSLSAAVHLAGDRCGESSTDSRSSVILLRKDFCFIKVAMLQ